MDFLKISDTLQKHFPRSRVVFGGSYATGEQTEHSDLDIYIVFPNPMEFYLQTRDKQRLQNIKNELPQIAHLHFMPILFLQLGLYHVEGLYFKKGKQKKFIYEAEKNIRRINSIKLCLKHLILYKLAEEEIEEDKHFYNLQKNFYFLTGQKEEDVEQIENIIENEILAAKTFLLRDWLLYSFRFRKKIPRDFEEKIISCLLDLKRFINTGSSDYAKSFYSTCSVFEKNSHDEILDARQMFNMIDRYIFLIFII